MCLLIRQQSLLRCHAVQDGDDDEDGASRRRGTDTLTVRCWCVAWRWGAYMPCRDD